MAQLSPMLAALVVLFLGTYFNLADAGDCRPAACSQAGTSGIFKYQIGNTYTYNLEGKTLIELPEQQGDAIKVELKAVAEVFFGPQCTNTLKIKGVQVTGPNAKKYANMLELESYPVRFSFNDGQIEPEICADADDSNTALNIKRAVISLFQVSTPQSAGAASKHEVDVFGGCPTVFSFDSRGAELGITKARNLNQCSFREDLRQIIPSSAYVTDSKLQSTPLLDANQVVELVVKNGVLQSAHSHETYFYRPFSNKDVGGKAIVHTMLTFVSTGTLPPHPIKGNSPQSLIFDTPHGSGVSKSSPAAIVAAMQACGASMPDSVKDNAATEFRNLVKVMRSSNKNDLLTVYNQVKAGAGFANKVAASKVFMDALLRTGTGDSVQVAVELLKSKQLTGTTAKIWYTSFAFVRHATSESLSGAASLLDDPTAPREAYLGVGALAGRYCREHNCHGLKEYDELLLKLSKPLLGGCKCTSNEQENSVIAALKGIENVKGINEVTAELVRQCMSDATVPARVRVAALDTFRSDACQPQLKKAALEILTNVQEDAEIRIKAYLAAVECPCGKCANTIKTLLESEPVNQVGAFIVSHLRNVRASNNPDKALQKLHLSEIRTTRKFPFDIRKFSRNVELSGLLDAVNIGSSAEANIIYSQQSYLPRSTSLNLTTEIFGHALNLFEIDTRAQNLDRLFESYFGPKSFVNTHEPEDIYKKGSDSFKHFAGKFSERFKKTFRNKRSVPVNALEQFRNKVYQPLDRKAMDLDLSVKLFGNTVGMASYHGDASELSPESMIDKLFDCMDDCIAKAKNFNHDWKHHATFLESDLVYPTGLGFPLKLSVSGSAAVHLKLDGKIDIQAIAKDPKNAHLQFEAVPSAALEIVGSITVDAYAVEAGLKLSGNLHTATGININVKAIDGTGFDMSVGLPVKKQELINFKSEILSSVQERGQLPVDKAVAFTTKRKDYHGCFDQLSAAVGLTFCGDVGIPFEGALSKAALFPLNGPSKLVITVESDDVQSYKFRGLINIKDAERRSIEFLIDTPNSQHNRKVEVVFEAITKPNMELRAKFISPFKTASAELVYVSSGQESSLTGKLLNDHQEYFVKVGAEISGNENHKTYTPLIEYRSPNQKDKLVSKKTKGKPSKQVETQYNIQGSVTVDTEGQNRKFTFNDIIVTVPMGFGKAHVTGWVALDKTSVSSDLKVLNEKNDFISVKGKAELLGPRHFKVVGTAQASAYPDLGAAIDWEYSRTETQIESALELVHGKDLTNKDSCLRASLSATYICTSIKDFDIAAKGEVTYPLLGIVGKIEGAAKPKSVLYAVEGKYDKYNIESHGHAKTGIAHPGDYDVEFEAKVLDSFVMFASKRDIVSPTENKFYTILETKPGGKYELTADTVCQYETNHVVQKLLAVAKIEGQPEPYKLDWGLDVSSAAFDGHVKASLGKTDYVIFSGQFTKGANPSGNGKVLLKNYIDGAGTFSYNGGQGTLGANLNMIKLKRNMKVAGTLEVTGTNRVGNIDLFFDDKDITKKIHFDTVSNMQSNAIDSKNCLIVFDYKTLFNIKGDLTGKLNDGHLKGNVDLTLPNGRFFTGSLDRIVHLTDGTLSGSWKGEVTTAEKKGAPARSLAVDAKAENVDRVHGFFDIDFNMVYKNLQAKDVSYKVLAKVLPVGDNKHVEFQGKIQGSLLDMAPMVHVKADIATPLVTYWVKVYLAADSNLELNGKCRATSDGTEPLLVENSLELNLPTGELKNIKMVESWSILKGQKGAPCEVKGSVSTTYNGEKTVTIDAEVKASSESGQGKVTLTMPSEEPRVIKGTYNFGKGPDMEREGSLTYLQGKKEGSVELKVKIPQEKTSIFVLLKARTPIENMQNFELVINSARKEKIIDTEVTIVADDKKAVINSKYSTDWRNPLVQVGIVHPKGKSFFGFYMLRKEGVENEYESELKYDHDGQYVCYKTHSQIASMQDFTITMDIDSTPLKLSKVNLVVSAKPGVKGGKSLTVTGTEAGQPFINGKLDYTYQEGNDGVLFDAGGNLKIRGENRQTKFTVKKEVIASPSENGIQYSVTMLLGDQTSESIFKQTNKEVRLLTKGCKAKGACGIAEYCSKLTVDGTDFTNEVTGDLDTTGLGLTTDIVMRRTTQKKGKDFKHHVEIKSHSKPVVMFNVDFNDKASSISLVTPSREMCADAKHDLAMDPKNAQHYTYKYELNAWLDKVREPENKATVLVASDYLRTSDSIIVSYEGKFQHPSLGKDMVVKSKTTLGGRLIFDTNTEVDVFAKKQQKIVIDGKMAKNEFASGYNYTITWDIKSKGQNLDIIWEGHHVASTAMLGCGAKLLYKDDKGARDVGWIYEITPNKAFFYAKTPKDVLVDIQGSYTWNKQPSAEMYFEVVGCKRVIGKAQFEKGNKLVYSIFKKETPDRKIQGEVVFDLVKKASARLEWVIGSETKELYTVGCSWSDKSTPEISYSLDNMKSLVELVRKDLVTFVDTAKEVSKGIAAEANLELTDVANELKKAQPNLKPLVASYQTQIKALRNEITSDQSVKELSDLVKKFAGSASAVFAQATEMLARIASKALDIFDELSNGLIGSLKRIMPKVTESCNKISAAVIEIFNIVAGETLNSLQGVIEFLKKHEADVKQIVTTVTEVVRDVVRAVGKTVDHIYKEVKEIVAVICDQIKAMPMFAMLQERIEELKLQAQAFVPPEQIIRTIQELTKGLQDTLPTQELRDFVSCISTYIEKLLKKEKVDYVSETKVIYEKGVLAAKSIVVLFKTELGSKDTPTGQLGIAWPFSLKALYRIPMSASVHLSPWNYLRSDDLPSLADYLATYFPRSWDPLDLVPPFKAYGVIVDTSHFFTFDKRHFTFKGTCSYVLAQDVTNGNFTLVLNLEGGKFKTMQLSDGKDTVEVTAKQTLLWNGQPKEFPIQTESMSVWRRYHTLNMAVLGGIMVRLDMEHHVTLVQLSGFYHGQVRGLLGDSNYEPFDDFRLPEGRVCTDVAEFGNAYAVGGSCAPGVAVGHAHAGHEEEVCVSLFAANSPIRSAFTVVDPAPYREACNHLVAETTNKKAEYACRIAAAYVAIARRNGRNVQMPNSCGKCQAEKPYGVGVSTSVKVPSQKADIILLVEQITNVAPVYKDLVQPLVQALTADLKSKGITNIEFSLIGFGHPKQKWIAHYTVNGKIAYNGKTELEFGDPEKIPQSWGATAEEKIDYLERKLTVEFGETMLAKAIKEVGKYPFRAGASKTILLITGSPCERGLPFGLQKIRQLWMEKQLRDRGISFNVVSPMDGFNIRGNKGQKNVVGFDSSTVYSFADSKKKNLEGAGNEDMRKDIEYSQDICIESTQRTNGAAFNSNNFLDSKGGQRKSFVTVVASKLAQSLTAEMTEDCTCTYYKGLFAESRCKVTGKKESEQLTAAQTETTKGTKKGGKKPKN